MRRRAGKIDHGKGSKLQGRDDGVKHYNNENIGGGREMRGSKLKKRRQRTENTGQGGEQWRVRRKGNKARGMIRGRDGKRKV